MAAEIIVTDKTSWYWVVVHHIRQIYLLTECTSASFNFYVFGGLVGAMNCHALNKAPRPIRDGHTLPKASTPLRLPKRPFAIITDNLFRACSLGEGKKRKGELKERRIWERGKRDYIYVSPSVRRVVPTCLLLRINTCVTVLEHIPGLRNRYTINTLLHFAN